ncbi:MAG: SGNH/GDSL hydrolase family protein [Acidobacteria bacterium]|nr:SGNH/GDSL hydrolase family protein [Acidobacteriota bacterium]
MRRVTLPPDFSFEEYSNYQVNYMNYFTGWLIPSTEVWIGDERWMRINAHGCRGEELDPRVGTIACFGDSTVFGSRDCWPAHVRVPGFQVLNAGVEGHGFERMIERYEELSARLPLDVVVVAGGWHNLVYNEFGEYAWASFLSRFEEARRLAVCTLATSLTPDSAERGLGDLIDGRAGRKPYRPLGSWPTGPAKTREMYDALLHYNDFVRRYCRRTGAILIDLFTVYRPESYEAMPDMFEDPAHARPQLDPVLARQVEHALAMHVPARSDRGRPPDAPTALRDSPTAVTGTSAWRARGRGRLPERIRAWIDGLRPSDARRERAVVPTADRIRRIRYPQGTRFPALQDFRINYFNNQTSRPIPNTEVWVGAERWLKINALGCKGEDVTPAAPTIGVFGDGTVWGTGPGIHGSEAWPQYVHVPGHQVLNGGTEDGRLPFIEQRYEKLRAAVNMPAVVLGGSLQSLTDSERQWRWFFDAFQRDHFLAICTLPTALTRECADRGLDPLIRSEHAGPEPFRPWDGWPTTPERTAALFDTVLRYNDFVRGYCAETGSVLIDLFEACRPEDYEHIPVMFRDAMHPRHALYPVFGRCASEALAGPLAAPLPEVAA